MPSEGEEYQGVSDEDNETEEPIMEEEEALHSESDEFQSDEEDETEEETEEEEEEEPAPAKKRGRPRKHMASDDVLNPPSTLHERSSLDARRVMGSERDQMLARNGVHYGGGPSRRPRNAPVAFEACAAVVFKKCSSTVDDVAG